MVEKLAKDLDAEVLQTHISWILIPSDKRFVLKIKKPVNFGFLDYTTLEKRKHFCRKEVELNRRLCPQVYEGVVPVSKVGDRFVVGDDSNPVEYAVKMKFVPPERLLVNRLDRTSPRELEKVARRLAEFHQRAEEVPEYGKIEAVKFNTDENFEQTKPFVGITISKETYERTKELTDRFYRDYADLFERRIKGGKIRDGHGDVRLEHVAFLDDGVCILDCIEFNDRFRYGDQINDMAFLAMELDYAGRPDLARAYEEAYKRLAGERDEEFYPLLNFYKAYRAFVRGKVTSFLLNDPHVSREEKERAKERAKKFFDLSLEYLNRVYP
ncbi:MAG: phosphotransferase [Aquificae bacterium]|nr:phosphotransferase [Aquificota bacterium]